MTIEQEWEKYKDRKHLIGTLPKSAYVRIMLYGLALQEQMEKDLKELGSVPARRMAARPPSCHGDERKAKERRALGSSLEIVVPVAIPARRAS